MNRGSNSQASGQTNDRTSLTGVSIPRRQIQTEAEKSISMMPRNVVIQIALGDCDEWENWAADHRESALGSAN